MGMKCCSNLQNLVTVPDEEEDYQKDYIQVSKSKFIFKESNFYDFYELCSKIYQGFTKEETIW